jgi:hypothetical protein
MNMNDLTETGFRELESLAQQSERMQDLMNQVEEAEESPTKALAQDCIEEILTYHNNGLQRILHLLTEEGSPASSEMYDRLLEDPFLSGLLLMHDLHPHPEVFM